MQTRCSTHSVVADECSCVFSVFSKILSEPPDSQNPKSVCKLHKFLVMFGTQVETEKVSPSNEGQTQHAQFQTEDWLYIYTNREKQLNKLHVYNVYIYCIYICSKKFSKPQGISCCPRLFFVRPWASKQTSWHSLAPCGAADGLAQFPPSRILRQNRVPKVPSPAPSGT